MPLGVILGFHVLPPFAGLVNHLSIFTKGKSYFKEITSLFLPLYLMLFLGLFPLFLAKDFEGIVRLLQVFCLTGFSLFIINLGKRKYEFLKQYSIITTILGIVVLIAEYRFIGHSGEKDLFGYSVPRYEGIFGESNYSSLLLLLVFAIHFVQKRLRWAVFTVVLCLPLLSRGMALSLFLFVALYFLERINRRLFYRTILWIFSFLSAAPFLVLFINNQFNPQTFEFIERLSAGRFYLWLPYIEMGLDNILGVGFFNGETFYPKYLNSHLEVVDNIRGHQINQQHSLFIQIFSEFGPVGYLLFIWQLFKIVKLGCHHHFALCLFSSMILGFSFLNGLTDFNLFFAIALCVGSFKEASS